MKPLEKEGGHVAKTSRTHLHQLAARGAEARLRQIVEELKSLTSAFPHLTDTIDADELPVPFLLAKGAAAARKARGRRKATGRKKR
jgi:hypothetical protein